MTDENRPMPPQPEQQQAPPGVTRLMQPIPDHGEKSYKGSGKLDAKVALITGADSEIVRAVAIAYAREGADIVIFYLNEDEDAAETARWVEDAGRHALIIAGDITSKEHCISLVNQAVSELGAIETFSRTTLLSNGPIFRSRISLRRSGTRRSEPTSTRRSTYPRLRFLT